MKILFVSEDVEVGDRGQRELQRLGHDTTLLRDYAEAITYITENDEGHQIVIAHQDDDLEKGIQFLLNVRVKKPRLIAGMLCKELDDDQRKKLEGCRITYFLKPYLFRRVIAELRTKKPPPKVTPWDVKKKEEAGGDAIFAGQDVTAKKKRGLSSLFGGKK